MEGRGGISMYIFNFIYGLDAFPEAETVKIAALQLLAS